MNYRPIIKVTRNLITSIINRGHPIHIKTFFFHQDTPDDEDENGKLSSQSDAYLVVEAEQIRVIEPVSRAIQETIKLSNVCEHPILTKILKYVLDSSVGSTST